MSSDYTVQGLDELMARMTAVINEFPYESEKQLKSIGNKFRRAVLGKTPTGGKTLKARTVLKNGEKIENNKKRNYQKKSRHALDKSYKTEIKGYGDNMEFNFWSTAPHFHLIERGHKRVAKNGQQYGFATGTHMVEKTAQEFEDIVPREVEKFVDRITGKLNR